MSAFQSLIGLRNPCIQGTIKRLASIPRAAATSKLRRLVIPGIACMSAGRGRRSEQKGGREREEGVAGFVSENTCGTIAQRT